MLAILTHSAYDLVREMLDRFLHQRESALHRQLRKLSRSGGGDATLLNNLQQGLTLLCRTLRASGGFTAMRQDRHFDVAASLNSLAVGSVLEAERAMCEDVRQPAGAFAGKVAWLAPAFGGLPTS